MLEFFFETLMNASNVDVCIFYTGKDPLSPLLYLEEARAGNVKLNIGRPVLDTLIPSIIYAVENGDDMAAAVDHHGIRKNRDVMHHIIEKVTELEEAGVAEDIILLAISDIANQNGLQLRPLIDQVKANMGEEYLSHEADLPNKGILISVKAIQAGLSEQGGGFDAKSSLRRSSLLHKSTWRSIKLDNEEAKAFVKGLDYRQVLSTWGMLFCGGSKGIEDTLVSISNEYDIKLNSESFEW